MTKKVVSIVLTFIMLFSVTAGSLTVNAASKNTVKTSISKVESKAKGFKVTWKKKSGIKGYQIQYSTSSKFKKSSTKTISSAKTTSATISKLKGCDVKYYVRVRTYKTSNGKKVYSSWSSSKKLTTLKHKYSSATCTKAKVCKYCKKTSGKALGHKYSAATCTKAKTCYRCRKTSGKALGHDWIAEDCTSKQTCSRCKLKGSAAGHNFVNYVCTECEEVDKSHAYEYLVEWVKENGTVNGSYVRFYYETEDSIYSLYYSAQYDYIGVDVLRSSEDDTFLFASLSLDSYFYGADYGELEMCGHIEPRSFTENTAISYEIYNGPSDIKHAMAEWARANVVDLISWMEWCFARYDVGITIKDLGFNSF